MDDKYDRERAYEFPSDEQLENMDKLLVPVPDTESWVSVEDVYSDMLMNSARGTRVISLKAPALSAEFVKSNYRNKAMARLDGAFIDVEIPSVDDVNRRLARKHRDPSIFGYPTSREADAFPAGYGERAATAVAREDGVYQLKSTFTNAAIAMSQLKAKISARDGDPEAVNELFARMWGITTEEASLIPTMELAGSEKTRMAALEDRAYHALSSHPAYSGGFRVDLASVTPDVLGPDIPLNWSRVRTAAKAIALAQLQGDIELRHSRHRLMPQEKLNLYMEVTYRSQPTYTRPYPWEGIMMKAIEYRDTQEGDISLGAGNLPEVQAKTYSDIRLDKLVALIGNRVVYTGAEMSGLVRRKSKTAVEKAVMMMDLHNQGRALITEEEEDEVAEYGRAQMGRTYVVPEYTVSTRALKGVMRRQVVGRNDLPDIVSHGPGMTTFSLAEIRQAGLSREMTFGGALNLAVFITTMKSSNYTASYRLMHLVKDPNPGGPGKVASRLRNSELFSAKEVRDVGKHMFDDAFATLLEAIIRNMVSTDGRLPGNSVDELWSYLTRRCKKQTRCPNIDGISELVEHVITCDEGWSLFYWARISIGKWHYASQNSILAPIAAGDEVDLIRAFKKGARDRAKHWASYYQAEYKNIYDQMRSVNAPPEVALVLDNKLKSDEASGAAKYIPPHLRQQHHLESIYEEHAKGTSGKLSERTQFVKMALAQVKKKFFSNVEVRSANRIVSVGITDQGMRELLIESYQARWLSLERRFKKAEETGGKVILGGKELEKHPWGTITTEFPETLEEVREWARNLEPIGWTVCPDNVWDRLQKSISEFWDDLSKELSSALAFIEETHDEISDEQAYANLESRAGGQALLPPTVLPSFGYVPPYRLPEKQTIATVGETSRTVNYTVGTTLQTEEIRGGEDEDDWNDDDFEPQNVKLPDTGGGNAKPQAFGGDLRTYSPETEDVLTYRELMVEFGFGHLPDDQMRLGFPLKVDVGLDDKHLDIHMGPLVFSNERERASRIWRTRLPSIRHRLGLAAPSTLAEDM